MYLIKMTFFNVALYFLAPSCIFISKNIIVLLKKISCKVPLILYTQNGTAYYLFAIS